MSTIQPSARFLTQLLFRLGLHLLDFYWARQLAGSRTSRLKLLGGAPPRTTELTPGVLVMQKDATSSSVTLWIGAFLRSTDDTILATINIDGAKRQVALRRYVLDGERLITGMSTDHNFYHRHLLVGELSPAGNHVPVTVTVTVVGGNTLRGECVAATLPRPLDLRNPMTAVTMVTASCYDVGTDVANAVDALWHRMATRHRDDKSPRIPDLTLLTGDQVYLDAPWWFYATLARRTPRTYYLLTYWRSWGGSPPVRGLRSMLAHGPTWFLPDDHEFWNNWPNRSVTEWHSFGHIGEFLRNAVRRHLPTNMRPPVDPSTVSPGTALAQNYLPVSPNEWGGWSRGAFDLFGSFQTRSVADCADPDSIPAGEGPDGHEQPVPHDGPLSPLVQHIDLGAVQVVLLDNRTRRTRSRRSTLSQFTDPAALNTTLAIAACTDVLVLATAQPVLVPAGYPRQHGWRVLIDHAFDRGPQDYWYQYERFWHGLVDARAGRPTVVLSGDIHRCYVAHVPQLALIQVVASPMSLVRGLGQPHAHSTDLEASGEGLELPRVEKLFDGPNHLPAPAAGEMTLCSSLPEGEAAIAHLSLVPDGNEGVGLTVVLHRRNPSAQPPTKTVTFRLRPHRLPATQVLPE